MHTRSTSVLRFYPALALEAVLSRDAHARLLNIFAGGIALGSTAYFAEPYIHLSPWLASDPMLGTLLFSGGIYCSLLLLRFFHNAYYYDGFADSHTRTTGTTYEVARLLHRAGNDSFSGLIATPQGYTLMRRLGFTNAQISTFAESARTPIAPSTLPLPDNRYITFTDICQALYETDMDFQSLLTNAGITDTTYSETVAWVTHAYYAYKQKQRWWSKNNLSKYTGLGRDWTYGVAYLLNRFSRPLQNNSVFANLTGTNEYAAERMVAVETILARNREANVVLVGEAGVGKMDILSKVAERIARKETNAALFDKRLTVLDTERILAEYDSKQAFERTFLKLLVQAEKAGGIVLIIENLAAFIRAGASIGIDIPALLDSYLGSPELNFIFTDIPSSFHREIERLPLMQRTEALLIEPPSLVGTERLIEDLVYSYEKQYRTTLTFPALRAIVQSADRYIVTGVMPDKAIDLLTKVMSAAHTEHIETITEDFVYTFVGAQTGIPVGPIDETEREVLLGLEDRLHERVVGQEAAITAISSAMRRARAGIQDSERPLGSFLFLGPTGVGKTETAKALAHVFFGNKQAMQRLDMSEFSAPDSLTRIIGDGVTSGILSNMMHEHPYAVVLLDEFEKGDRSVHDLFLQILDEGRFTDARGEMINMRNTIIIATSNAGSAHIQEAVATGKTLREERDVIIDHIISEGLYRPELINRFDGVIIFEPLKTTEQTTIAGYLLTELQDRVKQKGYRLEITDALTQFVATKGYNPEFGARPMRRVIQDTLEEAIARKIISGSVTKGGIITLTADDLA